MPVMAQSVLCPYDCALEKVHTSAGHVSAIAAMITLQAHHQQDFHPIQKPKALDRNKQAKLLTARNRLSTICVDSAVWKICS